MGNTVRIFGTTTVNTGRLNVQPTNTCRFDFKRRVKFLDDIIQQVMHGQQSLIQKILSLWKDGRVKLYITYKALNFRRSYRDVFLDGQYIPLEVTGQRQEHICAFARHKGEVWVLVVVPRLATKLVRAGTLPLGRRVWGDDLLLLPSGALERWLNTFTGERPEASGTGKGLILSDILCVFPVALLIGI